MFFKKTRIQYVLVPQRTAIYTANRPPLTPSPTPPTSPSQPHSPFLQTLRIIVILLGASPWRLTRRRSLPAYTSTLRPPRRKRRSRSAASGRCRARGSALDTRRGSGLDTRRGSALDTGRRRRRLDRRSAESRAGRGRRARHLGARRARAATTTSHRDLGIQHTPPIRANIHLSRNITTANHLVGTYGTKALAALDINPRRTGISAGIQLRAGRAHTKGIHIPDRARALAKGNLLRLAEAPSTDLDKRCAGISAAEQASISADPDLAGHSGVRNDVLDGSHSGTQRGDDLGEGGASVGAAVEGGARAGVEDGVGALVGGNGGARGEGRDGGEGALVLGAEDTGIARRPDDGVGVGRVGDGAAGLCGAGA